VGGVEERERAAKNGQPRPALSPPLLRAPRAPRVADAPMAARKLRFTAHAPTGEVGGEGGASGIARCGRGRGTRPAPRRCAVPAVAVLNARRRSGAATRRRATSRDPRPPPSFLQDASHPASDLVTRAPKSCGWQSAR